MGRRLLVPRTVTLLHSLLHSTGQHGQCVALADTVADEGHALYQAFTPDSLRELLAKIRESALAGMEKGRDAWGYAKPCALLYKWRCIRQEMCSGDPTVGHIYFSKAL